MKCKTMKHGNIGLQCMMLVFILAVCFSSCKDSKDDTSAPYDPNLPVEVTDFTPKSGGGKKKMIIYGSNFGIDCSIISVKVPKCATLCCKTINIIVESVTTHNRA